MRRTAALLVCLIALTGCSSGGTPDKATVTITATPTPSPTPSVPPALSQDEIKSQCSAAVAEAAPGWKDWSVDPGGWQTDPRTPQECLALADEADPASGNRAFMDAFLKGLRSADDPRASS